VFSGQWPDVCRLAALTVGILLFLGPLSARTAPYAPSYPLLTIIFAAAISTIVFTWSRTSANLSLESKTHRTVPIAAAALSAALLIYFAQRWVDVMLWNAYRADMLIIIREATQRFLDGQNPYFTYRNTYDAPWDFVLSYGPLLWGPFVVAQLLQMDMRVVTIVGELFVPIWCGVAMTVEAARGRLFSAAAWGVLFVIVLVSLDVPDYTLMGHTPVYWPLLPLFAALVTRRQWLWAAVALGLPVADRSTMVALVPVLLIAVWANDRRRALPAFAIVSATVLLLLSPFLIWDAYAIWDGMVATYPRVMKQVVWTSTGTGATDTLGLTGWLLAHRLERFVEPSQLLAMPIVYGLAWFPILRGARSLPWMGLALLVFSMTSLWPVFYIYYDVLFLFVSAALAETLAERLRLKTWLLSLAAAVILVVSVLGFKATPDPKFAQGSAIAAKVFRQGPSAIPLPRRSASSAEIVIACEPSLRPGEEENVVTALLNGKPLWSARLVNGPQEIRFAAPSSAWRIGYNRLELKSATHDSQLPPLVITRVIVVPRP
jgi:hypothetical protein